MPDSVVRLIDSNLYQDFCMTVVTDSYSTRILHVGKGVLQGDCLSPLLFNLLGQQLYPIYTIRKLYSIGLYLIKTLNFKTLVPYADDAIVVLGQFF